MPAKPKKEIIRSRKRPKPAGPDQLWQADMTYIWCGQDRWCYLFNVLDAFTREWVGYAFESRAITDGAIAALTEALASKNQDCSNLVLRTDNGSQYILAQFDKAVKAYGVKQEFIHHHTLEQNAHVESYPKSLKKEYLWPRDFETFQDAKAAISYAFEDYNQNRVHFAIGCATPSEFGTAWRAMIK